MTGLRDRYLSEAALSQSVVVGGLGFLTINRLLTVFAQDPDIVVDYIGQVALPTFAGWLIFTIASLIDQRTSRGATLGRAVFIALVYVATGVTRESLMIATPEEVAYTELSGVSRLLAATIMSMVVFPLISSFVGDVRRYGREISALTTVRHQLEASNQWPEAQLESTRQELVDTVRAQLANAFEPFRDRGKLLKLTAEQSLGEISRIVENVVQPLSASLSKMGQTHRVAPTEYLNGRVRAVNVLDAMTRINPFQPGYYIGASVLVNATVFVAILSWTERFFAVFVLVLLWVIHWAARLMLVGLLRQSRIVLRALVVLAVYCLSLVPVGVFLFVVVGQDANALGLALFNIGFGCFLLGLGATLSALDVVRSEVLEQFAKDNRSLENLIARRNAQVWVDQRHIATALHGEIQSILLVAQLTIQRALEDGQDVSPALDTVRELLDEVPDILTRSQQTANLVEFVEGLHDRWDVVCLVTVEYDKSTAAALDNDRISLEMVKAVVSEFIVNAVKHSEPTGISIELSFTDQHIVLNLSNSRRERQRRDSPITSRPKSATRNTVEDKRVGLGTQLLSAVMVGTAIETTPTMYRMSGAIPRELSITP